MFISDNNPAPVSLNGDSSGYAALPIGQEVTLQPFIPSDPSRLLFFRVTKRTDSAATDLTNASGFIGHGGTTSFRTEPHNQLYMHWMLATAAGAPIAGGASDNVFITVEV